MVIQTPVCETEHGEAQNMSYEYARGADGFQLSRKEEEVQIDEEHVSLKIGDFRNERTILITLKQFFQCKRLDFIKKHAPHVWKNRPSIFTKEARRSKRDGKKGGGRGGLEISPLEGGKTNETDSSEGKHTHTRRTLTDERIEKEVCDKSFAREKNDAVSQVLSAQVQP